MIDPLIARGLALHWAALRALRAPRPLTPAARIVLRHTRAGRLSRIRWLTRAGRPSLVEQLVASGVIH